MIIREYEDRDKEAVIKLISEVLFELFNHPPVNIGDLNNIRKWYFDMNGVFYVAEEDNKLVGTAAVFKEKENARLKRMYVLKDYRNKGLGKLLLAKITEFCKSKGYKKIVLSTYPEMKDAIKFYEKNNFKETQKVKYMNFEKPI